MSEIAFRRKRGSRFGQTKQEKTTRQEEAIRKQELATSSGRMKEKAAHSHTKPTNNTRLPSTNETETMDTLNKTHSAIIEQMKNIKHDAETKYNEIIAQQQEISAASKKHSSLLSNSTNQMEKLRSFLNDQTDSIRKCTQSVLVQQRSSNQAQIENTILLNEIKLSVNVQLNKLLLQQQQIKDMKNQSESDLQQQQAESMNEIKSLIAKRMQQSSNYVQREFSKMKSSVDAQDTKLTALRQQVKNASKRNQTSFDEMKNSQQQQLNATINEINKAIKAQIEAMTKLIQSEFSCAKQVQQEQMKIFDAEFNKMKSEQRTTCNKVAKFLKQSEGEMQRRLDQNQQQMKQEINTFQSSMAKQTKMSADSISQQQLSSDKERQFILSRMGEDLQSLINQEMRKMTEYIQKCMKKQNETIDHQKQIHEQISREQKSALKHIEECHQDQIIQMNKIEEDIHSLTEQQIQNVKYQRDNDRRHAGTLKELIAFAFVFLFAFYYVFGFVSSIFSRAQNFVNSFGG